MSEPGREENASPIVHHSVTPPQAQYRRDGGGPCTAAETHGMGGKVCLLQIARELRDSSPRPRRVVIATPARKVGEAKGTYQADGSTLGPPGLGGDRDRHMDI